MNMRAASVVVGAASPRMDWLRSRFGLLLVSTLIVLGTAEALMRHLGLHRPVLYEITAYGYRVKPNQDIRRFGHRIYYNEFGMRSEESTRLPAPSALRVLCIGDSITNGGALTDQAQTYPYLLEAALRTQGIPAEVMNASAAGWSLENAAGWLRWHGSFAAQVVVLEVATHDLFQPAAESSLIDVHPAFPSRAPLFASGEVLRRYLLPRLIPGMAVADPGTTGVERTPATARRAVKTVLAMTDTVRAAGGRVVVLQVEQPAPLEPDDAVTQEAKRMLRDALDDAGVTLVSTAPLFATPGAQSLFRDAYHPNEAGNWVMANAVAQVIERM